MVIQAISILEEPDDREVRQEPVLIYLRPFLPY